MKIASIAQFVTDGVKAVKGMPLAGKVAVGMLFGVGTAAGLLLGDCFEKETKENASLPLETKAETKAPVAIPVDTTAGKKEEVPAFEYNPPKVGENGIEKTDTLMYDNSAAPYQIRYKDKSGAVRHTTVFSESGEPEEYRVGINDENYTRYNMQGEIIGRVNTYSDGSQDVVVKASSGKWQINHWNKDRTVNNWAVADSVEFHSDGYRYNIASSGSTQFNKDGSQTETYDADKDSNKWQITYDKNGRNIKEKEYNADGTLKHTIIPRYNSEGDLLRNDTIPAGK